MNDFGQASSIDHIPLDGRLERSRLSPLTTAILALVLAFLLFQLVISPVTLLIVLAAKGVGPAEFLSNMETILREEAQALLIANTVGQILGIGLVAYLFARLHSSRPAAFLRLRGTDARAIVLSSVGILALIPVAQYLGAINEAIPLPEWLTEMEQAQMELLEKALLQEAGLFFNLVVLALTPAVCEEIMFRGYVQRQAERGLGAKGGILFSGLVFGLYHLRISQIIPLSLVGLYLAYIAWQFRSLWPAIIGHFLFNGFAVVLGAFASNKGANIEDIDKMSVPWYLFLGGLVILAVVLSAVRRHGARYGEALNSQQILEHPPHERQGI